MRVKNGLHTSGKLGDLLFRGVGSVMHYLPEEEWTAARTDELFIFIVFESLTMLCG